MEFIRTYSRSPSCPLSCIAVVVAFLSTAAAAPMEVPLKKSVLLQKLDSIDVEKQIRKRKGQSLDDLEKYSAALKDSITSLRTVVGKQDIPPPPEQTEGEGNDKQRSLQAYQKYVPRNAFDWIVLIVGAVAIIAGIILCVGFFTMLFGKKEKRKNAQALTMREILTTTPPEKPPEHFPIVTTAPAAAEREIDSLRKRVIEDNREDPPIGAPAAEESRGTGAQALNDVADLKKRILAASREGAGITELSRRFHVSTDQVSLILRVARQVRGGKK